MRYVAHALDLRDAVLMATMMKASELATCARKTSGREALLLVVSDRVDMGALRATLRR